MSKNLYEIERPTAGKWFKVSPKSINRKLFDKQRDDKYQEHFRQLVVEAFNYLNSIQDYRDFETMFPDKEEIDASLHFSNPKRYLYFDEMFQVADVLSLVNIDIMSCRHAVLEGAQRIHNGESWEDLCNNPDSCKWYRIIAENQWNNDYSPILLIGGSTMDIRMKKYYYYSPVDIQNEKTHPWNPINEDYNLTVSFDRKLDFAVPSFVKYTEAPICLVETSDVVKIPTIGKWFKVDPNTINIEFVKEKLTVPENSRYYSDCERTLHLILEAFDQVISNPDKYGRTFFVMVPTKIWTTMTLEQILEFANKLNCETENWIQHSLELSQRIQNGETVEEVLNTSTFHKLFLGKNGELNTIYPYESLKNQWICTNYPPYIPAIVRYET